MVWDLLFICDGLVAAVADPHFKLKAHEWDGRALGAALAAHSLPTLPAVVLEKRETGCHAPAAVLETGCHAPAAVLAHS